MSLRRPAFALLQYETPGKVRLLDKCNLNIADKSHVHGMILSCIYKTLCEWVRRADVLVRERGFSRFFSETQALFKVVGVADLAAWREIEACFDEIAPAMVKKLVTGSGKATKVEVADALEKYVGKQEYLCDDESDAVAVGVAWLILHGYVRRDDDVS